MVSHIAVLAYLRAYQEYDDLVRHFGVDRVTWWAVFGGELH